MKTILVISFSPLHRDPRVYRQIKLLATEFNVITAGYTRPEIDVEWIEINRARRNLWQKLLGAIMLKLRLFKLFYYSSTAVKSFRHNWQARKLKSGKIPDLIVANDVNTLPLALDIAEGKPVVLDAHEYSPGEYNNPVFRFFYGGYKEWLCSRYLGNAALMSTVGQAIAGEYQRNYAVNPIVVLNAPYWLNIQPSKAQDNIIRLVHHGVAIRERGLEEIIALFDHLDDRFYLDLYLIDLDRDSKQYLVELKQIAIKYGGKITFREPVPMTELPQVLSQYDLGLVLIQPKNYNYANCLPNKFFEFVQARLAIASGPTPEIARFIEGYSIGVVSSSFRASDLASELSRLTINDINIMKSNANAAAESLCFESTSAEFLDEVKQIAGVGK